MNTPKVSIIIPVYDVEKYIKTCLDSVIRQDYENIEALIVNDCTPDNSMAIVDDTINNYTGPINFIIINHTKNLKQSGARNTGIHKSTGKYVFFLDSDDELLPEAISSLVKAAEDSQSIITTANRKAIDWETGKIYKMLEGDYPDMQVQYIDEMGNTPIQGTVWNKLIRRDFLVRNNLYFEEGILYEDDLWIFKLYCCRPSFRCIPKLTYIYHVRPASTMQIFSELHLLSKVVIFFKSVSYLAFVKKDMLGYAYYMVENFRQGALMTCITNKIGLGNYCRLYNLLHNIKINKHIYFQSIYVTTFAKLRFFGNTIPACIGKWWNLIFIKLLLWKKRHNYPYLEKNKIILSKQFWDKIEKYGSLE